MPDKVTRDSNKLRRRPETNNCANIVLINLPKSGNKHKLSYYRYILYWRKDSQQMIMNLKQLLGSHVSFTSKMNWRLCQPQSHPKSKIATSNLLTGWCLLKKNPLLITALNFQVINEEIFLLLLKTDYRHSHHEILMRPRFQNMPLKQ